MCDIYTEKCKGGCGKKIDMHLADYNTSPDEIEVYCPKCVPKNRKNGVMWQYRDSKNEKWQKVFIRALTDNALANADGNHPNFMDIDVVGAPQGTLEVIDEKSDKGKEVRKDK